MNTQALSVPNISCNHCVMTIERELRNLEGVVAVDANAETKQVVVKWDDPARLGGNQSPVDRDNYPPA